MHAVQSRLSWKPGSPVQECFQKACLSANHPGCLDLKSQFHCPEQTQAAPVSCSSHFYLRDRQRFAVMVLKCLFSLCWLRGYLRILALVAAGSHMPDHETVYFGRVPAFLSAWETEVVPLQQESTCGRGCTATFELGIITLPKLLFSRDLLLWEKLLTKRQGLGGMEKLNLLWKAQWGLSSLHHCWLACRAVCCSSHALTVQET